MANVSFPKGRPLVVGANHRSSSLTVRDRLFVEDPAVPAFLQRLRRSGVEQAMVLSTCERVEVQAIHDDAVETARRITQVMAEHAELTAADLGGQLYVLTGEDAVRHIFTVTASLDSLMIGEPQILGQVKAGHRMARDAGMNGSELEALLQAAYGAAKRVRSETTIGERPVSIAAAAVRVAQDLHGDLARCTGLLVGGGDMAALVADGLLAAGLSHLTVTHPSEARAEAAARALDCHVAPFDGLARLLADADIVLTSMGTRRHVLTADMITAALGKRRRKPVFLVDTGIPGDIEPAVNRIDEAFLYDLNDLERVAMEGRATRETEAGAAWSIIGAEVAGFLRGRAERTAVPALTRLRDHFEAARGKALSDAGNDAEKATRLLVNRLLHGPSEAMRALARASGSGGAPGTGTGEGSDWEAAERVLERLFGLDAGKGPTGEGDDGKETAE